MEGLWCVVGAISFDLRYLALFAFWYSTEGAGFANGERRGANIWRKVESGDVELVRAIECEMVDVTYWDSSFSMALCL